MDLSGNKGEWSELYVFLRLLHEGRLNVADENLKAVPGEFYKILEIIRKETQTSNHYILAGTMVNIEIRNGEKEPDKFSFSIDKFAENAKTLLETIKAEKGRSFKVPAIASFLDEVRVSTIKDTGHNRDITVVIEDNFTKKGQELGFSIKSYLGGDSTLFNPGPGTNFIYEVVLPEGKKIDCDVFNRETYAERPKITTRLKRLIEEYGAEIKFSKVQSDCLNQNLLAIDGNMPFLLSQLLYIRAMHGSLDIKQCTEILTEQNPLGFSTSTHGNIYEYKIKRFLQDCAQGMTPETPWLGIYDADGGQIIVKEDGEVVCYHIYELNRFRNFLYNNMKLEGASTGEDENNPGHERPDAKKKFFYGWLYEEDGRYYIKINLQVRSK